MADSEGFHVPAVRKRRDLDDLHLSMSRTLVMIDSAMLDDDVPLEQKRKIAHLQCSVVGELRNILAEMAKREDAEHRQSLREEIAELKKQIGMRQVA